MHSTHTALTLVATLVLFGAGCNASRSQPVTAPTTTAPAVTTSTSPTSMPTPVSRKVFNVPSARITSTIKGDFAHGTEVRTFINWGLKESVVSQQEGSDQRSITLTDNGTMYSFGTSDTQGMRSSVNPASIWDPASGKTYEEFLSANFTAQGFLQTGTRTIAGKTCDIWKQSNSPLTICVWQGIPLSITSATPDNAQQSITEATSIEENPALPENTFTVPSNITFQGE